MRPWALAVVVAGGVFLCLACGGGFGGPNPTASQTRATSVSVASSPYAASTLQRVPSGSLVFLASGNAKTDMYSAEIGTGALTNLSNEPAAGRGIPSPDGKRLAFSSPQSGVNDIFTMNSDGTNVRNITNTPDRDEIFVSWSPDGSKILFGYFGETSGEYWVMKADGTDKHVVLSQCRECAINDWSPDSTELTGYRSDDAARRTELFVMNADGTGLRVIQVMSLASPDPRWSPDGSAIAYLGEGELKSTDLSSGSPVLLLKNSRIGHFAWAPSGRELAVPTAEGLVAVDAHSQTSRTIVLAANVYDPVWSRDGTRIAYVISASGHSNVYVIGAAGGTRTNVSNGPWVDSGARWSSDDHSVIFWSDRNSLDGVYSVEPNGGGRRRLISVNPNGLPSDQLAALPGPEVARGCQRYLLNETSDYQYSNLACKSPDGKRAAAVLSKKRDPRTADLAVVDPATGQRAILVLGEVTPSQSPPAWSPDGNRIAFYGSEGGKAEVFIFDLVQRAVRALTAGDVSANPTPELLWSQDGSYVFYTKGSGCSGGCWPGYLYRIHADGSGRPQELTDLRTGTLFGFVP